MNFLSPIHTEKRQCQDCYKCVRNCPVKAIKVENACAMIMPEACILCGNCASICPNGAKKVRDDLHRATQLLSLRSRVIVSLAPSYVTAFPGVRPGQMVAALKRLGFFGVSETALGAQQVSAHVAAMLADGPPRVLVSSACPTVVAFLQKHRPADESRCITPLLSPLLSHCKLLRADYGNDIGIVFFGPCIAKKAEADAHPELLDVSLTFDDLHRWLERAGIDPAKLPDSPDDRFIPERATDGAIYPVDGGMIAGIKANCGINDAAFMAFSGLGAIEKALDGVAQLPLAQSLMLELLACEGGCVNGPAMGARCAGGSTISKRYQVLSRSDYAAEHVPRRPAFAIGQTYTPSPLPQVQFTEAQLAQSLKLVGKSDRADELNCGGCGYDSCRAFAAAMLAHKAERSMCVTYMRQLAHKKADALIQKMLSAVVIVDAAQHIVECNAAFARLFLPGTPDAQPAQFEGTDLASVVPFHRLFSSVLRTGQDIVDRDLRFRETILHLSIFSVEKHVLVGGIIQDITKPSVQKEQVIRKAREVIQRNLSTVQKIAYLLGENAAESEITLNSIIESFSLGGIEDESVRAGDGADKLQKPSEPGTDNIPPARGLPHHGGDWRERYRR